MLAVCGLGPLQIAPASPTSFPLSMSLLAQSGIEQTREPDTGFLQLNLGFLDPPDERTPPRRRRLSAFEVPAQPVDATQALNLSAGVSNCKVCRGRSLS